MGDLDHKENETNDIDQITFHIGHNHDGRKKFQRCVQFFQLLHSEGVVGSFFLQNETKCDVEIGMQCRLITNDQ